MKTKILLIGVVALALGAQAQTLTLNQFPSRVLGHPRLTLSTGNPNLVEGRELDSPQSVAVDMSVSPPVVYVADTGNNRVLGWRGGPGAASGAMAEIVLGQRDFFTTTPNGPGTSLSTGFSAPTAVAVDSAGNLYVADGGNNRILRFPRPFEQTEELRIPDLVIGQSSLSEGRANQGNSTPSATSVAFTVSNSVLRSGLAFDPNGNLWITIRAITGYCATRPPDCAAPRRRRTW